MTSSRKAGARWCRRLAAVLVVAPSAGLLAMAAAPANPKAEKPPSATVASVKKPEANAANKGKPKAKEAAGAGKVPKRPAKVVSIPTLTSADLDALMEKHLESAKVALAKATTDVEFVRRVHLDLTGKLPTPEQVRGFVLTREKDKRGKLIEYLLRSEDYAENWARYWRDVIRFRATAQNPNLVRYDDLEHWLAEKFAKNAPWDEIAKGLITATGRDDENGAVSFALSHETQAVELAGEVSRVFLGVQIQCAQCHDHPNDSWKRQQFHEFAAYFDGVSRKEVVKAAPGQRRVLEVSAKAKPRYTMPDKLDPQKRIFVAPKFFLDPKGEILPAGLTSAERLGLAADYVTGQDNPWFAKAFVNRVWFILLGEGFYSPVDDMGPERTAKAPEVVEVLATEFQKGGYDVRWLLRTILNSRAYQREVRSTYTASGRTSFAAVCPSRLRADQILDSLAQAINFVVDAPPKAAPAKEKEKEKEKEAKKDAPAEAAKAAAGTTKGMRRPEPERAKFNSIFGVDPSTPYEDVLGTIPQALFLMNNPKLHNAMRANGNNVLGQILAANPKNNRAALDALYLRVLSREPTLKEVQTCGRYIDKVGNRKEAFEDILWSLINSTEFITRR